MAFSPDDELLQLQSKPISTTIDSGIAEMTSSSAAGTRTASEVEPEGELQVERSVSFLEALHELAGARGARDGAEEEAIPPPRSLSLTDDFLGKNEEKSEHEDEDREIFDGKNLENLEI